MTKLESVEDKGLGDSSHGGEGGSPQLGCSLTEGDDGSVPSPPAEYVCPISQDIMRDPVILATGQTYERACIEEWLSRNNTCPTTGQALARKDLVPNFALRSAIEEWRRKNGLGPWPPQEARPNSQGPTPLPGAGAHPSAAATGPSTGRLQPPPAGAPASQGHNSHSWGSTPQPWGQPQGARHSTHTWESTSTWRPPMDNPFSPFTPYCPPTGAQQQGGTPARVGLSAELERRKRTKRIGCCIAIVTILVAVGISLGVWFGVQKSIGDATNSSSPSSPAGPSPTSGTPSGMQTGSFIRIFADPGFNTTSGTLQICDPANSTGSSTCRDVCGSPDIVDAAARVACRQLGLSGGQAITSWHTRTPVLPYWLVSCSGDEASLADCSLAETSTCTANSLTLSAGVACGPSQPEPAARFGLFSNPKVIPLLPYNTTLPTQLEMGMLGIPTPAANLGQGFSTEYSTVPGTALAFMASETGGNVTFSACDPGPGVNVRLQLLRCREKLTPLDIGDAVAAGCSRVASSPCGDGNGGELATDYLIDGRWYYLVVLTPGNPYQDGATFNLSAYFAAGPPAPPPQRTSIRGRL